MLNELGYRSERTQEVGSVEGFVNQFAKDATKKQREAFKPWKTVDIVFQFTDDDIKNSYQSGAKGFDQGRTKSFLFLAVDMKEDLEDFNMYSRTHLAETTRIVNSLFPMPVILLFRHQLPLKFDTTLTFAVIHRRVHKKNKDRNVLEKVSLIKDIHISNPHRAHIDILGNLNLAYMISKGVRNFDDLHKEWVKTLNIEILNSRFYRELFDWFVRAKAECVFPDDGAGSGCIERQIIRLITRLLFIWFLKEKRLVPDELFEEEFARSELNVYKSDTTDYYRAILQNLFFATLNTEVELRSFETRNYNIYSEQRHFSKYRYRSLLSDPDALLTKLKMVPFVNGGLFDCLDNSTVAEGNGKLIDAFTENAKSATELCVPAHLFFEDDSGIFSIFRKYKFTVEESTPLDQEVALDPELLGRVFENLLATYNPETQETARKKTGSYYTPRPVVDYMVREALSEALAFMCNPLGGHIKQLWRRRLGNLLDHSYAMDRTDEFFEEADKRIVVSAIAKIRTLDPAVGSGAFPMAVLQTLTLALRRLDPNNTLWEEVQKERAKNRAGETFETHDQGVRESALREISETFEKYRDNFGRKLYLIQNGIHGVDIQPIACQIAKLRFFISLIIEQDRNLNAPNFGIKPLPNLEARLVAADSLLVLKPKIKDLLLCDSAISKQKEIEKVRERYFLADRPFKKYKCIQEDVRLRGELREILEKERLEWTAVQVRVIENIVARFPNAETRQTLREAEYRKLNVRQEKYDEAFRDARMIAEWDPYDQKSQANWFDASYMFGISNGFDVVIGNPPYIQLQKHNGFVGNKYCGAGYEVFEKTGDIYQLFYEHGTKLLKKNSGVLAYITSNSWLKAKYGKSLRRWFEKYHSPLKLIEMGRAVFKNAIVDSAILIVRNGKENWSGQCKTIDLDQTLDNQFPPHAQDWGMLIPKGDRPWMALTSIERTIMEKMETAGTPLKEWDISIYRGILTGYNAAFIVNNATRDSLVAEDPRSAELLRPILRGRDIARYRANWAGLWLIDTHNGYADVPPIDVNKYPIVKAHLDKFIGRLEQRQDRGVTPYNLRNCAYHEEFGKAKLFWMHMTSYGRFILAEPDVICNQKCFMITGANLKYLCAVLNSKLVTWLVRRTAVTTGMGLTQWDKFIVESVPVVQPDRLVMDKIGVIVEAILAAIEGGNAHEEAQRMIDNHVFDLYDLTGVERVAISNAINFASPIQ